MIRRREVIAVLGTAAWSMVARAQQADRVRHVRTVDERRSGACVPAISPIIGADDECRGISV
jgi:hypothetical protein